MNSLPPSSNDAVANESIVIVDGKRHNLSSLSILSRSRRFKTEPSLYPTVSNLPRIENADQVWALPSRYLKSDIENASLAEKWTAAFSSREADSKHLTCPSDEDRNNDESRSINRKTVEVTPGHFVPLRGADETLEALSEENVINTNCVFCDVALVVHAAASMIICPDCEMIAALEGDNVVDTSSLGLGLRLETLQLSSEDDDKQLPHGSVGGGKPGTGDLKRDPDEDSLSS